MIEPHHLSLDVELVTGQDSYLSEVDPFLKILDPIQSAIVSKRPLFIDFMCVDGVCGWIDGSLASLRNPPEDGVSTWQRWSSGFVPP